MRIRVQRKLAISSLATIIAFTVAGCGGGSSSNSKLSTATPTFSPGAGTYSSSQTVTISDSTSGAVLYCTTDGSTPTTSSPKCSQPTTIYQTQFLQAIAVAPGGSPSAIASAAYTIDLSAAATPTFSPAGGTYTSSQTVTISDATSGANIYYTTDGSTPSASSTLYTAPVTVSANETINAIAIASGYSNSGIASASYFIVAPIATPVFSAASGSYPTAQTVMITDATANALIYYTTDGSIPTASSTPYTTPISVPTSQTISAIAILNGQSSQVAVAAYVIGQVDTSVAAPTFSLAAGTYTSAQTLTLADTTLNAAIYYTTDGSTPSASSTAYTGPINVTTSETISAIAIAAGVSSPVVTATYTIAPPVAAPVFSVPSGTYASAQSVALTDATAGAAIYYTLDGSIPSATSTPYTTPISVTSSETITAVAILAGVNSPVVAAAYNIAQTVAAPVFSIASGSYTSSQTVSISDATPNAVIYYAINNPSPTASSTPYTGPITVSQTQTISAIAILGPTLSPVSTAAYSIGSSVAPPAFTPASGSTVAVGSSVTLSSADPKAVIYYTTNGQTPTAASTKYTGPVTLSQTGTASIDAVAIDGTASSPVSIATYTVKQPTPPPAFTPASGSPIVAGATVTIADTDSAATIYYTLDGSTPTTASAKYTAPVELPNPGSVTLNAIAVDSGLASTVATATYTVSPATVPAPTFAPASGTTLSTGQTVSLADTDTNATIYYTLDGSTPSAASTKYTAAIALTAPGQVTVKAIAIDGATSSGIATATYTVPSLGPSINVTVLSGKTPLVGASVQLYAAGSADYGSAAATVGAASTTGAGGTATLSFSCPATPAGALVYLVATGGNSGPGDNASIKMMTALGPCAGLTSGASFTINEATTIASAYALSQFMKAAPNVGSSLANYPVGLTNAFATVNNLVDVTTGVVPTHTPAYPTDLSGDPNIVNNSTVPQARIDTLANILNSCTATEGSGCAALFSAAAPPAPGSAPQNTLDAALDIAQNPGNNVTTLFGLATTAFGPNVLGAAPNDWTLALTFTGGGLGISPTAGANVSYTVAGSQQTSPLGIVNTSLAVDAGGKIWVTAYADNSPGFTGTNAGPGDSQATFIAKFSPLGEPLTPATSLTTDATPVVKFGGYSPDPDPTEFNALMSSALDSAGNLWLGNFSEGKLYQVSPALATLQGPLDLGNTLNNIAIDGTGGVWSAATAHIFEYSSSGNPVLSSDGSGSAFPSTSYMQPSYLAFDANGGLWSADYASEDVYSVSTLTAEIAADLYPGNAGSSFTTLVADGSGNVYGCGDAGGQTLDVYKGGVVVSAAPIPTTQRGCGNQLVLDGNGHLFAVLNNEFSVPGLATGTTVDELTLAGIPLSGTNGYTGSSLGELPTLNSDPNYFAPNGSTAVPGISAAIDGSGNLWVLNIDTYGAAAPGNVLVEFIGLGAPVVTPTSVALENGKLGSRP